MATPQLATFKAPTVDNEPMVSTENLLRYDRLSSKRLQKHYAPGSEERRALEAELSRMEQELPFEVPCIVNGKPVRPLSSNTDSSKCTGSRSIQKSYH